MDRTPVERILDDWDAVSSRAQPPGTAPRRAWGRGSRGVFNLLPLAAAALAIAIGVVWLGGRTGGNVGAVAPTRSAVSAVGPSEPIMSTPPSSAASLTPPAGAACDPDRLRAQVTAWEGAAGSRIADVTLSVTGEGACTIARLWRPELVDGGRTIRIEGVVPTDAGTIEIRPGDALTTLVKASNDCLPPPTAPVSVAFVLDDGSRLVAAPVSPDDTTTPPCLGAGQPASIEMQKWAR
ncbi:MAG: hypothetical protein QOF49_2408 [Chloroflexota bacterium]|jgi:hypothetical protein|nr:hypothetical protein [Chloroflexota bacterium]